MTRIVSVKGAVADIELVAPDGNTDDINGLIIRGRITFSGVEGGMVEFYVDNRKKYGCIYERDEKKVDRLNLSDTELED